MYTRPTTHIIALALLVLLSAACSGDGVDSGGIKAGNGGGSSDDGGPLDSSVDAGDALGDTPITHESCANKTAGSNCALPNASGVCINGRCQFLACEGGYRSCDDQNENGCETDVTQHDSCGGCGVSCRDAERCQLSRAGWVCSSTPVCADGRLDVDGEYDNGCEWAVELAEEGVLDPLSFRPQVAVYTEGVFSAAGVADDGRMVTRTGADTLPQAMAVAADAETRAVDAVTLDDSLVAVAWHDALTLSSTDGSKPDDGSFVPDCADPANPRCKLRGVSTDGASTLFAVDGRQILAVDAGPSCAGDPEADSAERQICSEPRASFGQTDYLSGFYSGQDFGGDQPPQLAPIGAQYLPGLGQVVVFTRRGFLLLRPTDSGFEPEVRRETPHSPQGASGPDFVSAAAIGDGASTRVYLLRADGLLRRYRIEEREQQLHIALSGPDIGLNLRTDAGSRHTVEVDTDGVVLIGDGRRSWLMQPADLSGKIAALDPPTEFHTDERLIFGTGVDAAPEPGFSVLYFELGRYYLQRVVRR